MLGLHLSIEKDNCLSDPMSLFAIRVSLLNSNSQCIIPYARWDICITELTTVYRCHHVNALEFIVYMNMIGYNTVTACNS